MQLPGAKTLWDSLSPRGELCVGLWLKRFRAMGIEVLPVKESARRSAPAVVSNALAADLVAALRKRVRGEVRFDAGSRALYATDLSIYRQPPIGVVIDNRAAPRRDGNESRDEWQYYISGKARMTVVGTGERARTMDFEAGDVGYIEKTLPHYIQNIGDEDLRFLELFRSSRFEDLSFSEWLTHTPPELVMAHLNIDKATYDKIPREKLVVLPR